jgi:hypothetical protein
MGERSATFDAALSKLAEERVWRGAARIIWRGLRRACRDASPH